MFMTLNQEDRQNLKEILTKYISFLAEIDIDDTKELISEYYKENIFEIISIINDYPLLQQKILSQIEQHELPKEMIVKYIDILCIFDSSALLDYLKSFDVLQLEESIEKCTKKCLDSRCFDAAVYLLEKQGRIQECFDILFQQICNLKIKIILESQRSLNDINSILTTFCEGVIEIIKLCQRNCQEFHLEEIESNFNCVLFLVIELYLRIKEHFTDMIEKLFQTTLKDIFVIIF